MKTKHLVITAVSVILAAIAVEAFYRHPTYGRGFQALVAVAGLV